MLIKKKVYIFLCSWDSCNFLFFYFEIFGLYKLDICSGFFLKVFFIFKGENFGKNFVKECY